MKEEDSVSMPIDLRIRDRHCYIVSAKLPKESLEEPFFLDSLSRHFHIADVDKTTSNEQEMLVRPLHYDETDERIMFTPINEFIQSTEKFSSNEIQAKLIFHMSRCGSTLVTQMLATSDRFFVVSEPPIINALLNPALILPEGITKMQVLRAIFRSIKSCKPESSEDVFIKFRSWNTLFLDEILEEFPDDEWMFVHRNGIEVLESVLRDPPGWLRSRHTYASFFAERLGLPLEELTELSNSEYATRLLGLFCKMAAGQKSDHSYYLEYSQIAQNLPRILEKNWQLHLSDPERMRMLERTKMYSKDPEKNREFSPDSEIKRNIATEEQKVLAKQYIEAQRQYLENKQFEWTKEFRQKML